jgi:hypothetical protein
MSNSDLFEITTIRARDEADIKLNNADGEPLIGGNGEQLSVTIYGPGSKQYAKAQAERNQRLLARMAKRGNSGAKLTPDEQTAEAAAFLAACTKSFNGWAYNGDPTAFEACYNDRPLTFIADQVQAGINDWGNFSSGSPKS